MMMARAFQLKRTVPWLARLALFVLLFQMSAVDHHSHPSDITGVAASSTHQMHCHGAVGSCVSGASEMPAALTQAVVLPAAPSLTLFAAVSDDAAPVDAEVAISSEPPRI